MGCSTYALMPYAALFWNKRATTLYPNTKVTNALVRSAVQPQLILHVEREVALTFVLDVDS